MIRCRQDQCVLRAGMLAQEGDFFSLKTIQIFAFLIYTTEICETARICMQFR